MKKILYSIFLLSSIQAFAAPKDDFVLTIDSRKTFNASDRDRFTLSIAADGFDFNVDCNDDGINEAEGISEDYICDYSSFQGPGIYTIRLKNHSGQRNGLPQMPFSPFTSGERKKIISLDQWGTNQWQSLEFAFNGAEEMTIKATDVPDLTHVTSLAWAFASVNSPMSNLNNWDVSSITDMNRIFSNATLSDADFSQWDVSSVVNMDSAFSQATSATKINITNWDVSAVKDMSHMFSKASLTGLDLSQWDVSSVTDMTSTFASLDMTSINLSQWNTSSLKVMNHTFRDSNLSVQTGLNQWNVSSVTSMISTFENAQINDLDLGQWNTSAVELMVAIFRDTIISKQLNIGQWDVSSVTKLSSAFSRSQLNDLDISQWDVSSVIEMPNLFDGSSWQNPVINDWDVSSVQNMSGMFRFSSFSNIDVRDWDTSAVKQMQNTFAFTNSINADVSQWNVSSVVNMHSMFANSQSFDPDIKNWDVSTVQNMDSIFENAVDAHPDARNWNISSVFRMKNAFSGTNLPQLLYDQMLISWSQQSLKSDVIFDAPDTQFCYAQQQRQKLIDTYGWQITDAGKNCTSISSDDNFTLIINSNQDNSAQPNTFIIETHPDFDYNYNVDCNGDGINEATSVNSNFTCDYSLQQGAGMYIVNIKDNSGSGSGFPAIFSNNSDNAKKITHLIQWGSGQWQSMEKAFAGASNLLINSNDQPDLSKVTDMSMMFANTNHANPDVSNWNVSQVTNMRGLFSNALNAQPNISQWDVSQVIDMQDMLAGLSLDTEVYDDTLLNWQNLNLQANVTLDAGQSRYCLGEMARTQIIQNRSWQINDGGNDCRSENDQSGVQLSTDLTGGVLLFPYFTVNKDFNTLLTITNTTDQSKALRLRFREAANSQEVFSSNIYLAPHDTWSAALFKDLNNDLTTIISEDESCSIPAVDAGVSFYKDFFTADLTDDYGTESQRLHEGFFEVIEMGVVINESANDIIGNNCQALQMAWQDGNLWSKQSNHNISAPTGGLTGTSILINVTDGMAITQPMTALKGFSDQALHHNIDHASPNLADGVKQSIVMNNGIPEVLHWPYGFEAVSSVISKSDIQGEYVLDEAIEAQTNWIISMPTRHFHYQTENIIAPFIENELLAPNQRQECEYFNVYEIYNRSAQGIYENVPCSTPILPWQSCPGLRPLLCNSTNTIPFFKSFENLSSKIFDTNYTYYSQQFEGFFNDARMFTGNENGMLNMHFQQTSSRGEDQQQNPVTIDGLPTIGFSVQTYKNSNAQPGLLANYAGVFDLKSAPFDQQSTAATRPAMSLNREGVGQVLLYPYYTVRNDLNTLITIVNNSSQVKAISVKFKEGTNAREVLPFYLYLDAYDVWTGALTSYVSTQANHSGESGVKLISHDSSCTIPQINNMEFTAEMFTGDFDDGLGTDLSRVTEGSIEVIEVGEVIGSDALLVREIGGDCQQLTAHWMSIDGQWAVDPSINIANLPDKGGIYGSVSIIDVETGIDYSYDATAISYYSSVQQHDLYQDTPNLSSGNNSFTFTNIDDQWLIAEWDSPVEAVSALFMQQNVFNDFVIDESINAQSEWIFNFPTMPFFTDALFANESVPVAPFINALSDQGACQQLAFKAYNREQSSTDDMSLNACSAINVLPITDSAHRTDILDSQLVMTHDALAFSEGWVKAAFNNPAYVLEGVGTDSEKIRLYGLPVHGLMLQKYTNGQLNNGKKLANYGVAINNKNAAQKTNQQ